MNSVNFLNLEYIYLRLFDFFKNFDPVAILNAIIRLIELLLPLAIILAVVLIYIIVYSYNKIKKLEKDEERKYKMIVHQNTQANVAPDPVLYQKWAKIEVHVNSANPSDWRLAILEADIMLNEILEKLGYQGDSIGEKLKSIKKEDVLTLQDAWEAHKIRNEIAHKGADFDLNEREAKRVISLYKRVFDEFYKI